MRVTFSTLSLVLCSAQNLRRTQSTQITDFESLLGAASQFVPPSDIDVIASAMGIVVDPIYQSSFPYNINNETQFDILQAIDPSVSVTDVKNFLGNLTTTGSASINGNFVTLPSEGDVEEMLNSLFVDVTSYSNTTADISPETREKLKSAVEKAIQAHPQSVEVITDFISMLPPPTNSSAPLLSALVTQAMVSVQANATIIAPTREQLNEILATVPTDISEADLHQVDAAIEYLIVELPRALGTSQPARVFGVEVADLYNTLVSSISASEEPFNVALEVAVKQLAAEIRLLEALSADGPTNATNETQVMEATIAEMATATQAFSNETLMATEASLNETTPISEVPLNETVTMIEEPKDETTPAEAAVNGSETVTAELVDTVEHEVDIGAGDANMTANVSSNLGGTSSLRGTDTSLSSDVSSDGDLTARNVLIIKKPEETVIEDLSGDDRIMFVKGIEDDDTRNAALGSPDIIVIAAATACVVSFRL